MTLLLGSLLFTTADCKDAGLGSNAGLSRDAGSLFLFGVGGAAELVPTGVPRVSHPPCLSFAHANLLFCAYVNLVSSARNHSG